MLTTVSHAKGHRFNPCTAHDSRSKNIACTDERAFALVHGHLIGLASLSEISGRGEVFLCPCSVRKDRPPSHPLHWAGHSFPWGIIP